MSVERVPLSAEAIARKVLELEELGRSIPTYVALTFDDGTMTQYQTIKQIIETYGIPVTWFIPTDPSVPQGLYGDESIMNYPDKLKSLYDTGLLEVGSHTHSHPPLPSLDDEKLDYELRHSKEELERIIGDEVVSIAYPGGNYNGHVLYFVKKYYKYGRGDNYVPAYDIPFPVRPWSNYTISPAPLSPMRMGNIAVIPQVILFHQVTFEDVKPVIENFIAQGAVFLKFSEFVEIVKKLPRLGITIEIFDRRNNAQYIAFNLGWGPGEFECQIACNDPATVIDIQGGGMGSAYGVPFGPTGDLPDTLQNIYDGFNPLMEVVKWDTANNIYIVRTRRPIPISAAKVAVSAPSGKTCSLQLYVRITI